MRSAGVVDHAADSDERLFEDGCGWPEREADMLNESRRSARPTLAGVHVEEMPGHADHLAVECGSEEVVRVAKRRGKRAEVAPCVDCLLYTSDAADDYFWV